MVEINTNIGRKLKEQLPTQEVNIIINKSLNNDYIVKKCQEEHIEIQPKLRGGTEISITSINIRGMASNQNHRHKMLAIETLTQEQQMMVYMETACTEQQKIWTCNDDHKVK